MSFGRSSLKSDRIIVDENINKFNYNKAEMLLEECLNKNNLISQQLEQVRKTKSLTSKDIDHIDKIL